MKTTACPKCGNFVSRNSKQCPYCGVNVSKRLDLKNLAVIGVVILVGVGLASTLQRKSLDTLQLTSELAYEGEVADGKANGKGRMTYRNLGTIEGRFENNSLVGTGILVTPDGKTRKVTVKNGNIGFLD
ncbi:MAG: hypothetical protein GC191_14935 [Azospirillum sp.]|nr:hypothetical protein [Azospirillum sp.]